MYGSEVWVWERTEIWSVTVEWCWDWAELWIEADKKAVRYERNIRRVYKRNGNEKKIRESKKHMGNEEKPILQKNEGYQ